MIGTGHIAGLAAAITMIALATPALAQRSAYEALIAAHAKANNVPESLVHRVVMRESRYNASLIGRGGVIGLMQIKLPTAREVGYTGDAEGLRDPATNIAYGVRYLAGAWRLADGSEDRAISLYAHGYYYEAKRAHLPPMHFAALPLAETKPSDDATDTDATEPEIASPEPTPPTDASNVNRIAALHGHVPLPRPRPQLPGDPIETAEQPPTSPPNSFSEMWDDITRLLPASH
jgi:Transglycosylase SLT domain